MTIRTFQPGDDVAQVGIYNEAAGDLPKFKPATLDEGMALSAAVAAAVEPAVDLCRQLLAEITEPAGKGTPS